MRMCDILEHSPTCFTEGKMDLKTAYDNDFFSPGSVSSVIWLCQSCQFELPIILNLFGWDISDSLYFLEARKTTFF